MFCIFLNKTHLNWALWPGFPSVPPPQFQCCRLETHQGRNYIYFVYNIFILGLIQYTKHIIAFGPVF